MNGLINKMMKLPIKKEVINRWISNPNYTGKPNTKIAFFKPIETDFVRLDDVIRLIEELKNE